VSGLPDQYKGAVTFAFGDSPALADELLALVLAGRKTATCAALRDYAGTARTSLSSDVVMWCWTVRANRRLS
jgi:uncharacterized protein YhfF